MTARLVLVVVLNGNRTMFQHTVNNLITSQYLYFTLREEAWVKKHNATCLGFVEVK